MKNLLKKLPLIFVLFLILGCSNNPGGDDPKKDDPIVDPGEDKKEDQKDDPKEDPKKDPEPEHKSSSSWANDANRHWHTCTIEGCTEKFDAGSHDFSSETGYYPGSQITSGDYSKYALVEAKKCKTCGYLQYVGPGPERDYDAFEKLPELRFTSPDGTSFATTATKDDLTRPEISGTLSISNCDEKYKITNAQATMKVRGNQTAGWKKKGFRIKFASSTNVLGLNEGKKFKKWVLFADAKDTALIRTALGLYISDKICREDGIWTSDFTPVNVYLNDQYWGYYYLAEQKETKPGRINLTEPSDEYEGTDIGYCCELDYYATNEAKKTDGDPTFTMAYNPKTVSYTLGQQEGIPNMYSSIAVVKTYTMLSTITNKTPQLAFIKKQLENSYRILYETAINKKAMMVNESGAIVNSTETDLKKNLSNYFDLNTWADGYLVNEIACTPDVGYSSFYMSFNNTASGDKKLRYENPWDFDSNFGNRSGFITNGDDLYLKRCANMWLNCLSKLDFFMDIVKEKWNALRNNQAFEMGLSMMKTYFTNYDADIQKNFQKWPENDAAYEVRDPFKNTKDYKKAQTETCNWLCKRVNYLEKQWGSGRADLTF